MSESVVLHLEHAKIGYPGKPILHDISLSVYQGQWLSLLGPNGCGKTTLLKSLVGSLPLLSGRRHLHETRLGYVPQRFQVPQDSLLTVEEFLRCADPGLSFESAPVPTLLGVVQFRQKPLRLLSRGELQRALLAFALVQNPTILFLDEYLEGLDPSVHDRITKYLIDLHSKRAITIIEVSHDITSVIRVADRVILLQDEIRFDGPPRNQGFDACLHEVYGHHHHVKHEHDRGSRT